MYIRLVMSQLPVCVLTEVVHVIGVVHVPCCCASAHHLCWSSLELAQHAGSNLVSCRLYGADLEDHHHHRFPRHKPASQGSGTVWHAADHDTQLPMVP